MFTAIASSISTFTCKSIELPPSPSSSIYLIVGKNFVALLLPYLRAPVTLFGGILPLTVSFRRVGTTDPPKSVDPAAGRAISTCAKTLFVERLPLMVSFRSVGTTGPPQSVDPAADHAI